MEKFKVGPKPNVEFPANKLSGRIVFLGKRVIFELRVFAFYFAENSKLLKFEVVINYYTESVYACCLAMAYRVFAMKRLQYGRIAPGWLNLTLSTWVPPT